MRENCHGDGEQHCCCDQPKDCDAVDKDAPKMIEIMMHDALRPDFERWLESRGLILMRWPDSLQEPERGTEQFMVTLGSERARRAFDA